MEQFKNDIQQKELIDKVERDFESGIKKRSKSETEKEQAYLLKNYCGMPII
jgi:hypothetical protein